MFLNVRMLLDEKAAAPSQKFCFSVPRIFLLVPNAKVETIVAGRRFQHPGDRIRKQSEAGSLDSCDPIRVRERVVSARFLIQYQLIVVNCGGAASIFSEGDDRAIRIGHKAAGMNGHDGGRNGGPRQHVAAEIGEGLEGGCTGPASMIRGFASGSSKLGTVVVLGWRGWALGLRRRIAGILRDGRRRGQFARNTQVRHRFFRACALSFSLSSLLAMSRCTGMIQSINVYRGERLFDSNIRLGGLRLSLSLSLCVCVCVCACLSR
mmetsp:Transcript_30019/g.70764  ORF Transcript_30019/g.70764 Transcript_30019/m.70764 type:complete len:264 (-) Transcript_30019:387-1178(-)